MKPPDTTHKKMGPGGSTPEPRCIALEAIAVSFYANRWPYGNQNEQWLAVPRSVVELAIDTAIDWLDLIDRLAPCQPEGEIVPENAL